MEAIQVIEEILSKVFKWHRFPVSLKAEAVLLYFKGLSLRAVREFLLHKGYEVSIETIREWFHAVGKALQAIYTTAVWVYVDETKIKARDRTYYLWLAVDEKHRIKRFYKRFPWNAKYETVYRWLASFIVIYTIMNLKS
jgi:transposase-like protein